MATKRAAKPAVPVLVEPDRPLGRTGRRLWDQVHAMGEVRGNIEPLLMCCERLDERTRLRARIEAVDPNTRLPMPTSQDPADRTALRALEQMIKDDFELLGIRTILPVGVKVVADDWTVSLATVR